MDSGFEPEVAPESLYSNDLMQADLEELEIEQPYDKKVPSYNEIAVTSLLEFISNGTVDLIKREENINIYNWRKGFYSK